VRLEELTTKKHAEKYNELRVEALLDSPEAFGTTYAEHMARSKPIERVYNRFQEDGNYTFGMLTENDDLLGVCTLLRQSNLKEKHKAHIFAMYVTPSARKEAVGKQLVTAAIEKAKEIGVEQIMLSVVTSNKAANRLYESLGFSTYGIEKHSLKDEEQNYWDENLMVLFT
jgi:ribosomal protein S18 acetylase RimI-like enzyme